MEMRHMKMTEGAPVWVRTPAGLPAVRGWENGHETTTIHIDAQSTIPKIVVRSAAGREITVPRYELLAGFEYRARGDWIAESDPRVLDWLESEVKK
jgi:hypothetical protein